MLGPGYTGRFRTVLASSSARQIRRVVFAVPGGTSWPLPLYELALMTAAHVAELGLRSVELTLVTPEAEPLELFGPAASQAVRTLLAERNGLTSPSLSGGGRGASSLAPVPDESLPADRVVSLPGLRGPSLPGLPRDREGVHPAAPRPRRRGSRTSTPPEMQPPARSSRAASRPNKPTPPRRQSRHERAPTSSRGPSARFCEGCF